MKKLAVWSEGVPKDESVLYLRLEYDTRGTALFVCNEEGRRLKNGSLLVFHPIDGYIILLSDISRELPFKTDIGGHLLTQRLEDRQKEFKTAMGLGSISPEIFEKIFKTKLDDTEEKKEGTH